MSPMPLGATGRVMFALSIGGADIASLRPALTRVELENATRIWSYRPEWTGAEVAVGGTVWFDVRSRIGKLWEITTHPLELRYPVWWRAIWVNPMKMWLTRLDEARLENRRITLPWVVAGARPITMMTTSIATNRILLQAAYE